MKHTTHTRRATVALAWLFLAMLFLATPGCSTIPDWSAQQVRDYRITAVYDGADTPTTVTLPISTGHLLILDLQVGSDLVRQSFTARERRLHLPPGLRDIHVECRYRVFRESDPAAGAAPWPSPESLFPGATRVDCHD